jgi:hypothetical protein
MYKCGTNSINKILKNEPDYSDKLGKNVKFYDDIGIPVRYIRVYPKYIELHFRDDKRFKINE